MNDSGRIENLPPEYVTQLRAQNLVPLWPSLRCLLPHGKPNMNARATHWPCAVICPLLKKNGS